MSLCEDQPIKYNEKGEFRNNTGRTTRNVSEYMTYTGCDVARYKRMFNEPAENKTTCSHTWPNSMLLSCLRTWGLFFLAGEWTNGTNNFTCRTSAMTMSSAKKGRVSLQGKWLLGTQEAWRDCRRVTNLQGVSVTSSEPCRWRVTSHLEWLKCTTLIDIQ